ncbi:MAG TPA: hypothetical protein VJ461_06105 [Candidatus Nanoarchaeia archaeon]|nr:hypothetical protein [Candidatus Nanoarchaeia archaeon]
MNAKKTLTAIVLSASMAAASPFALAQKKQEPKFRFSLKPSTHRIIKNYESHYFSLLQERMRKTGKDYAIVQAPGDNMPIIVPNLKKYNLPIIKPGPGWYDDKSVIRPGPEWSFPKEWLFKEIYKNNKLPSSILLYEWKHK